MIINFSDDQDEVKIPKEAIALLKKGLQAVAKLHKLSAKTEVSVSLVRHLLGDIIISAETAVRQGKEYGHGLNRELVYLGVHSLLHLLGYDHMKKEDKAVMRQKEEEALRMIGLSQEDIDAKEKDPEHFAVAVVDAAAKKKKKNKGKKTLADKLSAEDAAETAMPDEIARTAKGKDKMGKSDVKKADKNSRLGNVLYGRDVGFKGARLPHRKCVHHAKRAHPVQNRRGPP